MRNINECLSWLSSQCGENDTIPDELYEKYHVFRGLRDLNGNGVLTGLTNISTVTASEMVNGQKVPRDGELLYRGHNVKNLIASLYDKYGYETIACLLLSGAYPDADREAIFVDSLEHLRKLPKNFTREVIMGSPTGDIMNCMSRSILTLASYDSDINNTSIENNLRQCMFLISVFPMLAVYAFHSFNHYLEYNSMIIRKPKHGMSVAESILHMLRPDGKFSPMEAKVLDTALILHMEHGGGNNSTFTTRVVTSSGSDTYSTIAAAMASLKGPKHGGANIKASEMMADISKNVHDKSDKEEISAYLSRILNKDAFDKSGLIYGMGHAIYSLSDPRELILKEYAKELAKEKGLDKTLAFYESVEHEAIRLIYEKRKIYKGVCPNIDFYSGFVYKMLGIPKQLYTPMFAVARIVGWSAHRIEELIGASKIIRPAYMSVCEKKD